MVFHIPKDIKIPQHSFWQQGRNKGNYIVCQIVRCLLDCCWYVKQKPSSILLYHLPFRVFSYWPIPRLISTVNWSIKLEQKGEKHSETNLRFIVSISLYTVFKITTCLINKHTLIYHSSSLIVEREQPSFRRHVACVVRRWASWRWRTFRREQRSRRCSS